MIKFIVLLIPISAFVISFSSCNKEPAHIVNEEFVGNWGHIENTNERWYIDIGSDSYGSVILYDSLNDFITAYGENPKKWRINETTNTLKHGILNASFHIIQYPTIANNEIIDGLDTIPQGEMYLILDEGYFLKY